MQALKRIIGKVPGIRFLHRLIKEPQAEIIRFREYRAFKNGIESFHEETHALPRNKMLVISLLGNFTEAAKMEAFLVKSVQSQNVRCYVVTFRDCWANLYYRSLGIRDFIYFEDILAGIEAIPMENIAAVVSEMTSFDELMAFERDGVQIGKYICSTLVRETYHGHVDLADAAIRDKVIGATRDSIRNIEAANQIFDTVNPDMTLFLERGYTPYGEFFDLSLLKGLNTIQWCGSHRNDALTLKRYTAENRSDHPATVSKESWALFKNRDSQTDFKTPVYDELFAGYKSGKWYGEVGTQFNTAFYSQDELKQKIGIDPEKKTAAIFSHLFWDATFFYGADLFENYREWFVESVRAACENDRVNWLVKMHPANKVKLRRDGYQGELVEVQAIRDCIGDLPGHVKLIYPETDISTFSLFEAIDYCITVRGTVGIEAACFGKRVFTAGTGRYDHLGFTQDSETRAEYMRNLRSIDTFPEMRADEIALARKFAFIAFIARPFELRSLKVDYKNDAKATMDVQILPRDNHTFKQQPDVMAFGEWAVHSTAGDYLNKRSPAPEPIKSSKESSL